MHYAFDLDATIGDFDKVADILDYFYVYNVSFELNKKLIDAYYIFVEKIVEQIKNGSCKIFNPEILHVIQDNNVQNAVIYSNNSHYETLVFAKDVIEAYFNRPVFCFLMHWGHDFRIDEIVSGDPGNGRKTWLVLKRAFKECSLEVKPDQVLFYDDQKHPDLMQVLGENYIQVRYYRGEFNSEAIKYSVARSLTEVGLDNDDEYKTSIEPIGQIFGGSKKTRSKRKVKGTKKNKANKKKKTK